MQDYSCIIEIGRIDMDAVRDFFLKNEEFMLRLVENPMVFEHKSFTDLCIDYTMVAITDEIYEHILYDRKKDESIGTLPGMRDRTITIG